MATIRNRLFPYRDVSEHNTVSLYSLNQLGLAGQLVKIVTGTANPQTTEVDGYSSTNVGVSYNGTYSKRYKNNWEVAPTASGDSRLNAIGITLLSTQETDENDMPLRYNPERAKQIGTVVSGETVPVATAGFFGIWGQYIDTSLGAPQPGHLAVVSRSGDGRIAAIAPTSPSFTTSGVFNSTTQLYSSNHIVGKWLSSLPSSTNTGIAAETFGQGGYAFLSLNCTL